MRVKVKVLFIASVVNLKYIYMCKLCSLFRGISSFLKFFPYLSPRFIVLKKKFVEQVSKIHNVRCKEFNKIIFY